MKSKKKAYLKKGNIIKRNFKKGDTVKSSNINELDGGYNFTGFFYCFDNINISEVCITKYNIKSKSPLYIYRHLRPNDYISTRMVLTEKRIQLYYSANRGKPIYFDQI